MKGLSPVIGVVLLIAISVIASVGVWYWVGSYTQKDSFVSVDYDNPYVVVSNFNGSSAFLRNLGRAVADKSVLVYNDSGFLVGWFGLNESGLEPNEAGFYDLHLLVDDLYAGQYLVLGNGYPKTTFRLSEDYLKPIYVVFFARDFGNVYAYYENGSSYWGSSAVLDSICSVTSSPAVKNGRLFIGDDCSKLFCLNSSNGSILWNFTVPATNSVQPYVQSSPFVKGGVVYFSAGNGYVYALNVSDGNELWNHSISQTNLNEVTDYSSSPVVVGDYLYVGEGAYKEGKNGSFYKLDINNNGAEVCSFAQEGGNEFSSVLVRDDVAYIGSGLPYNYTYAFYTSNCSLKWKKSLNSFVISSPLLVGNYLIISEDGNATNQTYALNISSDDASRVIWNSSSFGDSISSSAFYSNGLLYVGSDDNYLHVLNLTNGQEVWNYKTGEDVDSSPVVVNGVVYFGSSDNSFYAVNVSTHQQFWNVTSTNQFDSSPVVCNIRNWNCVHPTISGMSN